MIDLESIDHIYLFPGSTDLRKGRHSLALLARRIYAGDGLHELFLFCNRKNELIKNLRKGFHGSVGIHPLAGRDQVPLAKQRRGGLRNQQGADKLAA